jgi:hypothetical protein
MATEDVRVRLRTKLESAFGAEEASILMDRPPGGWNDLVTNQVLEARLAALEHKLVATVERGFRVQTWRLLGAIFVAFGLFATLARLT